MTLTIFQRKGFLVQGAGDAGTPDPGVFTVQGISGGTPLPVGSAPVTLADNLANPITPEFGANLLIWDAVGSQWVRARGGLGTAGLAVTGLQSIQPFMFNGTNYDVLRGDSTNGQQISLKKASLTAVSGNLGANTGVTLTLPAAGVGLLHYITHIRIERSATAALAGTASLLITTTNLSSITWKVGNAMAAGGTQIDVDEEFVTPMRSQTTNTASTIVIPAPGAAVIWNAFVHYYTGVA